MTTDETKPPLTRWTNHVTIHCENPQNTVLVRALLDDPLFNPLDKPIFEAQKTEFEVKFISGVAAILNTVAQTLGLPARGINLSRVHILRETPFLQLFGSGNSCSILGHAYITRTKEKATELFLLTYEMVQLAAHTALYVTTDDQYHEQIVWQKIGYMRHRGNRGVVYQGFNVAAMEIAAGLIRDLLIKKGGGWLDKKLEEALAGGYLFLPQVLVMQELNIRLAQTIQDKGDELLKEMLLGLFSDDQAFLRRINKAIPGAVAILRAMDTSLESACVAAHGLGFEETYQKLNVMLLTGYEVET